MRIDLGIWWQQLAAIIISVGAVVSALAVINAKVIAPWIAKPIARAVRHELTEFVEIVFVDSHVLHEHIREVTEEVIASEMRQIMLILQEYDDRLIKIESNTEYVKDRMIERPPRH